MRAIVLMGPPGSGKSFLGNALARRGIVSYVELEPILRERFGSGDAFRARIAEVGAFLARSYREQLAESLLPVALESTGITDRPLLDAIARGHRIAFAHVRTPRSVCIERVVGRTGERNISATADREVVGRFYDTWLEKIAPTYHFELSVDGVDLEAAVAAIRAFVREGGAA